jgi:hypothetical protein
MPPLTRCHRTPSRLNSVSDPINKIRSVGSHPPEGVCRPTGRRSSPDRITNGLTRNLRSS